MENINQEPHAESPMTRYDLIRFFTTKIEKFETESKLQISVANFNAWLFEQYLQENVQVTASQKFELRASESDNRGNIELSVLVGTLFRYVKTYAKRAFEGSEIQNIDEFTFLVTLLGQGEMSKTELISKNVMEKTTGMEIIKRLTKQGFLFQKENLKDGRSQVLSLSTEGRLALYGILEKMSQVSTLVSGNLAADEKLMLFTLLNKLDHFHRPIFDHEKNASLAQISEKYLADDAKQMP
jgi:MarR family transcriptional regulator, lower aerobic nicotinate degradation pathway regulator